MGLRRVRTLTPADLAGLSPCAECGCGADGREELNPHARWARASMDRWGLCGVGLGQDAWLLLSPVSVLPAEHPLAAERSSAERKEGRAAILLALHIADRRRGVGRQLVQTAAARLIGQAPSITAAGGRSHHHCSRPPAEWLMRMGFEPCDHVDYLPGGAQRLTLDLNRTVTWHPASLPESVRRMAPWSPQRPPEAATFDSHREAPASSSWPSGAKWGP